MSTAQTVCVFASGYLFSRLVLRAGVHEHFVSWVIRRTAGRTSLIVLGVMACSFALSTFIPNALTVLALIPVVTRLRAAGDEGPEVRRELGTLLAMGLVYGANVGGMGSLLGSPANLYLLVNLRIFDVPGREALHFASWLTFGLPMAASFLLACWLLLCVTERVAMARRFDAASAGAALAPPRGPLFAITVRWGIGWVTFWVALFVVTPLMRLEEAILWRPVIGGHALPLSLADLLAVGFLLLLTVAWFAVPQAGQRRLLEPRDLVRELPVKGLLAGLGVLVLLVVVAKSGVVEYLGRLVPALVPAGFGPFVSAAVLSLVAIFATEVLNNTTVATVLFPLSVAIGGRVGADPLLLMLGVSLASTCAFMTPVATPVNALAFAGIGHVSLKTFAKTGVLANLIGGLWIALWLTWLIPPVLSWYR